MPEGLRASPRGFDVIGSIALVEFRRNETRMQKKAFACALMEKNHGIRTVLERVSDHEGKYRLPKVKGVGGKRTMETIHVEHGCRFHVRMDKAYFSPRLSTERMRIAGQVKPGEVVGVLGAGVGPFPIILGKKTHAEKIIGFEWNPVACTLMRENIALNRLDDRVSVVQGDARRTYKKFMQACDRIVLALPFNSLELFPCALACLKPNGGRVHFYGFSSKKPGMFSWPLKELKALAYTKRFSIQCKSMRIVRNVASSRVQIALDLKVAPLRMRNH
ncbi:MAG: hypothetical protein HY393_00945 [Candidatus Diapherotrites archaeon]|nr:hypothetical protein [Candidatus Diapherotrites archaeon]